ncbi:MAG: hypothetical protein EA367_14440 [Leptolyngbya sp. DLM2.Bin15]|nr:MAG: hypothetical protein EA367_14440 [Leptolyngbya sp. DLM2.Bin15]
MLRSTAPRAILGGYGQRLMLGLSALALVGLVGCGADVQAECAAIVEMIQAAESDRTLGSQTRAITLDNAQRYQALALDLQNLDLQDDTLAGYRDDLAVAYQELSAVQQEYAEWMDADGTIRYRSDETNGEQRFNALQAQLSRAYSAIQTASELYANYCVRTR